VHAIDHSHSDLMYSMEKLSKFGAVLLLRPGGDVMWFESIVRMVDRNLLRCIVVLYSSEGDK
jgi:hypothetical protein